ncbi:hypothetical protein WH47_11951 [Habropoda laboriosa]|uniref:C3H1-type domain-containing protein n=1 Tax=Habropoda laboriosa TaxID=597456 RepID=A0A0L7R7M9_9HYME|nr:hypothetical protein WH47_11951 [Habropoda laboriosa]
MASDLSSEGTETIGVLDEKEEGEISLEDVSSSEEGHLNYGYGTRVSQCTNCLSSQHNASWCTAPAKIYPSRSCNRREVDLILQDAVQGKENRHQIKESGCIGTKHIASTLQEKNDDLVPISSDSDMEIVGLADNSKQIIIHSTSKSRVKKKRKKKRNHTPVMSIEDVVSSSTMDIVMTECVNTLKHDVTKNTCRPHHREISPVHGSNRSRVIPRTPPRRHRSLIRPRSPFKRSKSPLIHTRSPTIRRSPRRLKSPKRSPYRSSTKAMPRKTSHPELSSHNYGNMHKLLKKVRQLDSMGTHSLEETLSKNKEHASSLKEKLTNMMKGVSDNNSDIINSSKEKSTAHVNNNVSNDADEEEDLALLRQKALETKQNKSNKQNDQPKTETARKVNVNINDDQDEEDLKLRMIALRSAVLKKHQNRVQKGIKSGKNKKSNASRSESPFTQSFLDSIPIPGEELLNFASPPHTPLPINENNHTEDMEIDTDVEREKEKLPYSPTDKITANISMDTELLGIQPSDVSFIRLNEANNSPNFNASIMSSQDDQKSYQGKIIENRSYLPNIVYYATSQNPLCPTNANMQYLSTNPEETSKPDFMKIHNSHADVYQNTCNIDKNNTTPEFVDINSSQEMPYSPTDTPVYDPDLSHVLPQTLGPLTTSNSSLVSLESYASNAYGNSEQYSQVSITQNAETTKQANNINEDEQLNKAETLSLDPVIGSATTSLTESVSPSSSMITIDDLPETDADANPLTDPLRNIKSIENIPNDSSNNIKETTSEPLYMKGIPDVTKDINKIPTLINRTLVPAPILKTNKQLQLPLPARKVAVQQEPTFKSAKMQSVDINEESSTKMNASFKPIKLQSIPQKSHSVLDCTAFQEFLHEDTTDEVSANKTDTLVADSNDSSTLVQNNTSPKSSDKICDIKSPTQKKKKLLKKGLKRKNTEKVPLLAKRHESSCTNSDNINIVDKEDDKDKTDDKENMEEVQKQMDMEESINTSNLEASKIIDDENNKISSETNEDVQTDDTSVNDSLEQAKSTEDRRQSLDEDEEALRAILLASLPKRTKTTNNIPSSTITTTVSTVSNQVLANETVSTNVSSTLVGGSDTTNTTNADVATSLSITSGRKRSVPIMKGPQKKLVKRISIPASTKVVNNAKKYQNAMIQKKLNLQKATLYNKQKIAESKIICKVQSNDSKWSANAKTLSDIQRIVINLESDTESDSESERQKNTAVPSSNSVTAEKPQATVNSTAEFEKNLDQFLRAVRKKQESMAAARPTSILQTAKKDTVLATKQDKSNSSNVHTPLAVRHLPASQQEEYRRLKQQILEREKLKLHRTIENNNLTKNKSVEVPTKPAFPSSPNKESHAKLNQTILTKSPSAQQLNKENCSKNVVDSVKNTFVSSTNVQLCTNKINNVDKQGNTSPNQTKIISRPTINSNILVPTETNPSNIESEAIGNSVQSTNTSLKIFETSTPKAHTKILPGLKILSTNEVNEKYMQVQVTNDRNERVVTINDKVTLSNKTVINRDESVSEKDVITNDTPSGDNNVIDSDASTTILSRENQSTGRKESIDTSESTIRLSQYEEDKRTSLNSNAENREDVHFLLFKNNTSPKGTRSIEENWEALKKYVKTELNTLIDLSRAEQEQRLMDTEQKLVLKRYTILDDLAEMSGNLRQWHMERDLQTNLAAEVKKLREQLKVAEERLQVQRNRINSIGPKVVAAHGKINAGRQECFKLATICSTLGSSIVGTEYKVPEAGAQLLDCRLKEVANHTRQLSRKKVPSIDISETYESRLGEETVSTTFTEVSETTDLLEECNVDNLDTTILNKNEFLIKSNETEKTVQIEVTTVNVNEASKDESMVLNNSAPSNNERSISEENNTEQEVSAKETNLSDTPVVITGNLNSENAQDLNNKEVTDSNVVVRPATLEPGSEKRNCTKPEGEFQAKKTLLPYESILTYFKVPRNTNPNGVLCPYELMGTCSDGDCQFVHQTENQAK